MTLSSLANICSNDNSDIHENCVLEYCEDVEDDAACDRVLARSFFWNDGRNNI